MPHVERAEGVGCRVRSCEGCVVLRFVGLCTRSAGGAHVYRRELRCPLVSMAASFRPAAFEWQCAVAQGRQMRR
eukprot:8614884-Lingulodinium_polyedra.AAC.1